MLLMESILKIEMLSNEHQQIFNAFKNLIRISGKLTVRFDLKWFVQPLEFNVLVGYGLT